MVDAVDSKSIAERRAGSSPAWGTKGRGVAHKLPGEIRYFVSCPRNFWKFLEIFEIFNTEQLGLDIESHWHVGEINFGVRHQEKSVDRIVLYTADRERAFHFRGLNRNA